MIFYLEPETGDDANDGLTEATAVKTMKRALAIGYQWLERQTPRFNPDGSYDGPTVLITLRIEPPVAPGGPTDEGVP